MKIRTERFFAPLLFVFFTVFYFLTRTPAYSYDGLCYALDVEFGPPTNLFHANHLLFGFFMRQMWHLAQQCGYVGPALYVMQVVNLFAAAGAVALLFHGLAPRIGRVPAALAALWLGASHALWMNATDPGCYGLMTLVATALLLLFFRVNQWRPFTIGLLHGMAILFHQLLLLPAGAFFLQFDAKDAGPADRRHPRMFYLLGLASSCGVIYGYLGWHFHGPGLPAVTYWLIHPADAIWSPPGTHFWAFDMRRQLGATLESVTSSFIGPHQKFWVSIVWASLAYGIWKALRAHGLPRALWLWPFLLFSFQFFYFSDALTYRLLAWPALLALLAAAPFWKRPSAYALGFFLGGLLFYHSAMVAWATHVTPSPDQERTAWVRSVVTPRDFFIFAGRRQESISNVYVAYFAHDIPARSLYGYLFLQHDGNLEPLNRQLQAVALHGGRIFIEQALRNRHVLAILEQERGLGPGTLTVGLLPWKTVASLRGPDGYALDQSVWDFQAK